MTNMNENEINDLEQQLRSWVPRHPSAKVSRRLFAQAAAPGASGGIAAESQPVPTFRLGWLAPVAASFLLMGLFFNQRNGPAISGSAASGPLIAVLMSNQGPA